MPSKAKFTTKTKQAIVERDEYCVYCGSNQGGDIHHVYFGINAEYGPDRNHESKGVLLCGPNGCHHEVHHGTKGKGKEINDYCINYLEEYYA